MTARTNRSAPSLTQMMSRWLLLIGGVFFVVNSIAFGIHYGYDRKALEAEIIEVQIQRLEDAIEADRLGQAGPPRSLYTDHSSSYAFALSDASGNILDAANLELIPPGSMDVHAGDWITRSDGTEGTSLVAGRKLTGENAGNRLIFAMRNDPAGLWWRAYFSEIYGHVWLPILPLVLLILIASNFIIRRSLASISQTASWARNLQPGSPTPPPDVPVPAEIADLVNATQRSVERLAQALEAEKRNAAEAAHALRTPLAVLVARLDGLAPGENRDRLRADMSALSRTVKQVLASSRADTLAAANSLIDLKDPAENVVATLAPFAYDRGVELSLVTSEQPVLVRADMEGAELALTNLVENAIIHGEGNPVDITVGPGPVVSVRDHGPGIRSGTEEHLFEAFWRDVDAAPGGSGLGLSIVKRIQRLQGGEVEVMHADGGGAEFSLHYLSK